MSDNHGPQLACNILLASFFMSANPHADEFDEAEYRLRQDIEEAIEQAADCLHDAPSWWAVEEKGPRTIDTMIGMIVLAAKEYRRTLEVQRIQQLGERE